jgi:hypothetical protein
VGRPICSPRARSSLSGVTDEPGLLSARFLLPCAVTEPDSSTISTESSPPNPGYPTRTRCCSAIKEKSWPPLPFFHLKTRVWSHEFEHRSLEP